LEVQWIDEWPLSKTGTDLGERTRSRERNKAVEEKKRQRHHCRTTQKATQTQMSSISSSAMADFKWGVRGVGAMTERQWALE
jgi:hypothetical protein